MNSPFSNGTQRMDWMCRNCDRCTKFDPDTTPEDAPCDIDAALTRAAMGDEIPDEIMKRMGVPDDVCAYTWDCPERELGVENRHQEYDDNGDRDPHEGDEGGFGISRVPDA